MNGLKSLFVFALIMGSVYALDNGVAKTPPMGWLSWMRFACNVDCDQYPNDCVNAKLYMDMADRLAADGFKEAGYDYVNIDDCWSEMERDGSNNVVPDMKRFPQGIKGVCDYIHSKGLKCGLYTDIGTKTCGGYPSLDTANNVTQTQQDIDLFVSWGIDSLKVDGCNADTKTMSKTYPQLSEILLKSGRPIMYSCSWPAYVSSEMTPEIYASLQKNCNIWRNWNDINDTWESLMSIIGWWKSNGVMAKYAQPGAFNDPDMIIIGNNGLSRSQQEVQMAMWAIFAAPLLMSNDLRDLPSESRDIILNPEVIAINQDSDGHQGTCVIDNDAMTVWARPLSKGRIAVAMLNLNAGVPGYPRPMSFTAEAIGLPKGSHFRVRDVLARGDLGTFTETYTARVGSSAVHFVLVEPAHSFGPSLRSVSLI